METSAALEEQCNIPVIAAQMVLIQEIQTGSWWQDITVGLLEDARRKLRGLVHLIDKRKRDVLYTRFEDEIGEATEIAFARFTAPDSFEKFRAKARHFLRQHENHVVIHKLRGAQGLGLFVRSLVGMDRAAAKAAFAGFLNGRKLTANQIELMDMVVEHLTENGVMPAGRLYESPYTDLSPSGIEGLFNEDATIEFLLILDEVERRAAA